MAGWCENADEYVALVLRAGAGDRRAFEALVRRYYRLALAYADSILKNYHSAEDAVQESFLAAAGSLASLRSPQAFPGWLRKIVFARCDRIKRKRHAVPADHIDSISVYPGPEEIAEEAELVSRLNVLIDQLPSAQRTTAELCFLKGYSPADVACFLEVKPSTVRKRLHDARARLRAALKDTSREEVPMKTMDKTDEIIERLFANRISDDRLERLIKTPSLLNVDGEARSLTVLFADMVDMVGVVAGMKPMEVRDFLNTFFTEMSRVVIDNGGFLDKMVGDLVMAVWGTPANPEEHAASACRAALAMHRQLTNTGLSPKPQVAIGIHSGEAIIGNFGPPENQQYTPMGDHVNFGAMLESKGRSYGVQTVISEVTKNLAGNAIRTRKLDTIQTPRIAWEHRGGERAIDIYEPISDNAGPADEDHIRLFDAYDKGIELFDAGEFTAARRKFVEALVASDGADGPSIVYLKRCAEAEGRIRADR